jgi:hypothetical protein
MDAEEYRLKLEQDIINIIVDRLEKGEMDTDRARSIARLVLDKLHPPLTLEQIYEIAPSLDDTYTELTKAVLPVIKEHDEKIRNLVTAHVSKLIQGGKLEEATSVVKNALAGTPNPVPQP